MDTKVLIGLVTQEYARRADFYDYFHMMKKPANTMVLFCHDRSPAHGRNIIIEEAKKHECTHILFIDDDMCMRENALEQLLEHDLDIVTGLYLVRAYPHMPLIFDIADESGACLFCYLTGDEPRLKEVLNCGFGFCLVKTSVFDKMEKPYVRLGEIDAEQWCDDTGFFNRVRKAGIKIFCDMDCCVGHIGSMIVWPNKQDGKWFTGYDFAGATMVNVPQIAPMVENYPPIVGPSGGQLFTVHGKFGNTE